MGATQSVTGQLVPRPVNHKVSNNIVTIDDSPFLTKKQKLFVEYYLRGNNAAKAARLAGYSPHLCESAASTILKHHAVREELRRRSSDEYKQLEIETDWVIHEAFKLASANLLDYGEVDDNGYFKPDLRKVTRDMGAAIQEFTYDAEGRPRLKLVDKKASLELLARIKKMFNDGVDPTVASNSQPLTIETLDNIVKQAKSITVNQQQIIVE